MTEEEFFMGFADVWNAIGMPSAHSIGALVGIISVGIVVVFVSAILYLAVEEVIKTFKRKVSQRANPLTPPKKGPRR